jgi:hypothetical protein
MLLQRPLITGSLLQLVLISAYGRSFLADKTALLSGFLKKLF